MKSKILKELKNAGDYVSGQQLCERLGVSRTAVWKHIKALRAEGYEIDSVTNKGYKLVMEVNGNTTIAFEDNVYRGTYRGIGKP